MKQRTDSPLMPYLALNRLESTPLYQQLYRGIRTAIRDGRLRPRQRLPATRELARELGISRFPVLTAFEQLIHEGYIVGRVGAGTYVTASIHDRDPRTAVASHRAGARESSKVEDPLSTRAEAPNPESLLTPFRVSLPALDRFPSKTWSRLVSRSARAMSVTDMAYSDPAGYLPLREAIANYLRTARAVQCEADQVLVVSGSQMALRLCAMVLLKAGDEVCVENPGYPGARDALSATGAIVRGVPVDPEGLRVRSMVDRQRVPRIVHVTPSHQYPLGMPMSASRRLELLDWARRHRSWVIEDDYDSEYRFASRPLAALQGMDGSRVIYVGTFSKVMFPSLRLGYIVVPRSLLSAFIHHRESLDLFSPTLYQLAMTDFFGEGHFARHVRRMRSVYLGRRNAFLAALDANLRGVLSVVNADAGMHVAAWLRMGIDDREVVRRAAARGISATALSTCYMGRKRRMGLVLGFSGADETQLADAVETLAVVIRNVSRTSR